MLKKWGEIPDKWMDPTFRERVTGRTPDIAAHMNFGELAYGDSLGKDTRRVWWRRNVEGQGHPGEDEYLGKENRE